MKMALDNASGVNVVTSYEPGRVQIREHHYRQSLIVLPKEVFPDWQATHPRTLRASDFATILERSPEVLIVGTGDVQVFPDPEVFAELMGLGIGIEIMDNGAACRTYNVLLAEDRRAALALILAQRPD